MQKTLKLPAQQRVAAIALVTRSEDEGQAENEEFELSFSSEEPYERWWGVEILGHEKGEVNLDWMESGRAPLLVDHDMRVDSQVGTISKVWLEDGRGKAVVRFGKNARSLEIMARVKSGDLSNVSVGYRIEEMVLVKEEKNGPPTYRVTQWTPYEASIVAVPADQTVGVGRGVDEDARDVRIILSKDSQRKLTRSISMDTPTQTTVASPSPDEIRKAELKRIHDIEALGQRFNKQELARKAMADGTPLDVFRGQLLDSVGADTFSEKNQTANSLGLTTKEARQFSFTRLIASAMNTNPDRALIEAAAFEREVCAAEQTRSGRNRKANRGNSFTVPVDILRQPFLQNATRDLTVGTATAGGHLVQTNLMSGDFISLLRNRMALSRAGARVMNGLEGNIAIPRQTGGATFYWVAESGAITESQQAVDQVTMSPKTGGAFTDFSRRLMLQSSLDAEVFVRDDLINTIALGVDFAGLHGSGSSNQPLGLAGQSGVNVIALGTNGLAPTWAHIVQMETDVAVDNADVGTLSYITNAKVRGKLKTTEKASSTGLFVWQDGEEGMGSLNGYRAVVSNQVRSNMDKGTSTGVCSGLFYGNFNDLIMGFWSGIDILVDPYTGATAGNVRVIGMQDVDIACRQGASFSYIADALTV